MNRYGLRGELYWRLVEEIETAIDNGGYKIEYVFSFGKHDVEIKYENGAEPEINIFNVGDGAKRTYPNKDGDNVTTHYPLFVNEVSYSVPSWEEVAYKIDHPDNEWTLNGFADERDYINYRYGNW